MCVAKDVRGPWKRTIFPEYLYDPGLFFDDDGKSYVVHGQGSLYLTELSPDALSAAKPPVKIWSGKFNADGNLDPKGPFGLEGSHVYKVGGRYYILCPGGGTEGFQICLRSDNLQGPYEWKCVLKDDSTSPPNGLHQGGMVQLKSGDWWSIIMQDRGPLGRVPNLLPVKWIDGWPMLGVAGAGVADGPKPNVAGKGKIETPATSDEFNSSRPGLQWQWNHNPDPANWSLAARPGYLRLTATAATGLDRARNQLTQRIQGPASEATTHLDYRALQVGDEAGLSVFQSPYAYIAIRRQSDGDHIVVVNNGKPEEDHPLPPGQTIYLRATTTTCGFAARFSYSLNGKQYAPLGPSFEMQLGYPWTGNRFGLFNFTTTAPGVGGAADFEWFHLRMVGTGQSDRIAVY